MKDRLSILSVLLALASGGAGAATYYFADCQSGAIAACIPGNNANPGTSPSAPKKDLVGFKLTAGDTYRFARGGAWIDFRVQVYLPRSRRDAPTVFEDYTPTWGTGAPHPILRATPSGIAFRFENGGNSKPDEGYVVRNLELRGVNGTGKGIFVFNDADYITVDNVIIDGFHDGVHLAGSNPLDPGSNGISEHFTLKNSIIRNNPGQGFLGGGHNLLISDNEFDNNGFGTKIFNHNIYLESGNNVTVRGNRLTRNARFQNGPCSAISFVAHGPLPNLVVENNFVFEDKLSPPCYGIDLNNNPGGNKPQDFSNLVVRGNTVIFADAAGSGGLALGCSSCPNAVFENNLIVAIGGKDSTTGIVIPSNNSLNVARGDKTDTAATVRNNTIYIDNTSTGSIGVRLSAAGSVGDVIASNLIYFGPRTPPQVRCFSYGNRSVSSLRATGGNLCSRAQGAPLWSNVHRTLAEAQQLGLELGSSIADPMLSALPSAANGFSLALREGSPAVDRGLAAHSAAKDITGRGRDARPDIGAYETVLRPREVRPRAPGGVTAR